METKIKWNEGDGYITATYEGSGSGSASISSDINEGIDRVQTITVDTTQGSEPKSESVQVTQIGLREVFEPSDGLFVLKDGGTYNVLKIGVNKPEEPELPNYSVAPIGVSIATKEGLFIPFTEWNNQGEAVGVACKAENMTIILDLSTSSYKWASSNSDVSGVPTFTSTNSLKNYTKGQEYTQGMAVYDSASNTIAQVAIKKNISVGEKTISGYVGSSGEWAIVANYATDVEAAFSTLGLTFASGTVNYWTSCERAAGSAWVCKWTKGGSIEWGALSKTNARVLRVFFKYE